MANETVQTVTTRGLSMLGLLGVILCSGKAFGLVSLAWWQVTLPFWIMPGILIGVCIVCCGFAGGAWVMLKALDFMDKKLKQRTLAKRREGMN